MTSAEFTPSPFTPLSNLADRLKSALAGLQATHEQLREQQHQLADTVVQQQWVYKDTALGKALEEDARLIRTTRDQLSKSGAFESTAADDEII